MKGLFITFEGPDGSGKTTQIRKLANYLKEKGIPYILTREPGGTKISDDIRSIILNPAYNELTGATEILLYAASRAQHVREKIKPALQSGKIVLCDRFVDASIAYQGYGLGVSLQTVKEINEFATEGLTPDRTYLLDISPENAKKRMLSRMEMEYKEGLDRIEQRENVYHRKVREGFSNIYRENKHRICFIDGDRSEQQVFEDIKNDVMQVIDKYFK
ncbi:dTMP kinase [Scopulibacillus cellulosilyticus]|uniref:Thymidylate kinase n=1 Tax=Scopulibacillus cellulosilyticus TaxID=2665665 RepID=A0ABW2PZ95_9BACL